MHIKANGFNNGDSQKTIFFLKNKESRNIHWANDHTALRTQRHDLSKLCSQVFSQINFSCQNFLNSANNKQEVFC